MSRSTNTKAACLALLATAGIAGCGGSDSPTPNAGATTTTTGTTATTAAAVNTPVGKWATDLCTQITAKAKVLQPPTVSSTSPGEAQKSLITFFTQVSTQLGDQAAIFKSVGAPPDADATKTYKKAYKELKSVRKQVVGITAKLKGSDLKKPAQLQAAVAKLGTQLQSFSSYGGPVAALAKNATLDAALKANAGCETAGAATS